MPQQPKYSGSGKKFLFRTSFSDVIAAGVDSNFDIKLQGAGQTVSQPAGNLNIASGTTINAETILRSKDSFTGSLTLRYWLTLSQRIANHNTFIELVDVVADSAAFTILSATSVAVTVDQDTFDKIGSSKNIGQSMYISGLTGTGIPSQRGVIAAVAPNVTGTGQGGTITFTVAGYPGTGSGTVYLYGYNTYRILYDGTTATFVKLDTQRNGWYPGDSALTINITATPGHSGILDILDGQATYLDELPANATIASILQRGRRATNVPDTNTPVFLQIRVLNGTTAPASTTTTTIGFVTIEDYNPQAVVIEGVRPTSNASPLPVSIQSQHYLGATSTVGVNGVQTHDAANTSNHYPVKIGYNARATNNTAVSDNDVTNAVSDLHGRPTVQLGNVPQLQDMNRITLTTTTETTLIAAVASVRHGIHSLEIANRDNVAHTLDFRDTTAGTIRKTIIIPAGVTYAIPYDFGLWQLAVNTNWTVTMREVATTAVEISATSYRVNY